LNCNFFERAGLSYQTEVDEIDFKRPFKESGAFEPSAYWLRASRFLYIVTIIKSGGS